MVSTPGPASELIDHAAAVIIESRNQPYTAPGHWAGALYEAGMLVSPGTADTPVTGETSDGFHTFNELYDYRMLYNAALFNEWGRHPDPQYDVHKSWHHSDGEPCFGGGWFVVFAQLPTGQISNHYAAKDWDMFQIPERELGAVWDGHTPADVAERLRTHIRDWWLR